MAIYNFGSINIDHFYALPHLPEPGETLSATRYTQGLGGKGANQSVAAARAGAEVFHIGAIGRADGWVQDQLQNAQVDCRYLRVVEGPSGHAIIYVDEKGENAIVLSPAANIDHTADDIYAALENAKSRDILLLQNETNLQAEAASFAASQGLKVIYSAAPFSVDAVRGVLPFVSLLVMNEGEAEALCAAYDLPLEDLPVPETLVTLGSKGAIWRSSETGTVVPIPALRVDAVDTTGAGDTFIGYVAAGLDLGLGMEASMRWATRAAALKVTRFGTADAIPTAAEVNSFYA